MKAVASSDAAVFSSIFHLDAMGVLRAFSIVLATVLFASRAYSQDAVSSCPMAGYGFITVPGSTLCIAPRGFVRADYLTGLRLPPFDKNSDAHYGTIAKVQIGVDFIAATSEISNGGRVRLALARESGLATVWTDGIGGQRSQLDIDEAWMRIGPVMAGRGPSRFDFYRDAFNYTPLPVSDLTANFIALRIPLTPWLYAEVSLEDAYERVNGLIPLSPNASNKPDVIGVLRASMPWPYPAELHFSAALPQSNNSLFAWQAGGAFDLGGERPHLLILQVGMARGAPSFAGMDRGMMQAIAGADLSFYNTSAMRSSSGAIIYRRPIWNEYWTVTNFAGFGFIKPAYAFNEGLFGPAALLMAGGNLEWRSRQGLMIGGEAVYVASQSPASPYTRFGEGLIFRLRIERGF